MIFAPLSLRFLAASLDFILCESLVLLVTIIFPDFPVRICSLGTLTVYWIIMVAMYGTTLGGRVFGLGIVTEKGESLSKAHSMLRLLPELALLIGLPMVLPKMGRILFLDGMTYITLLVYLACMLPALWTKEKVTLFDKLCKTRYLMSASNPLFYTPAPIWRRFIAYAIDSSILLVIDFALVECNEVFITHYFTFEYDSLVQSRVTLGLVQSLILNIIYWVIFPTFKWRGTLGMKWLGLQYTHAHYDQAPTILQFFMRTINDLSLIILGSCLVIFSPMLTEAILESSSIFNAMVEAYIHSSGSSFYIKSALLFSQVLFIISVVPMLFTQDKAALFDILSKVRIMHVKKISSPKVEDV